MKTILLICSAGMSTNLLVLKMEEAAKEEGIEVKIIAIPSSTCAEVINDVDIALLSPQVRFQRAKIQELVDHREGGPIPIGLIDMKDYSTMNGKAVFDKALSLLK